MPQHTVRFITRNFGRYDTSSLASYESIGGFSALKKAVCLPREDIVEIISQAHVKGRGGAGYDMGRKWRQAREVPGPDKVIVCNADEGEPGTFKDRALLENDPFLVVEAMILAGYTMEAENGYIYLREEYSHLRPLLLHAISQVQQKGYLGENILGKGFSYHLHLYSGAGAYVCGEGTALVESMAGKGGRPRLKPPFIKQCGLFGRPTCLNNVESLCLAPHLLCDEEKRYQTWGTGNSVGSKLISVSGNVRSPGVFEIPFGVTLREIIYDLAGGVPEDRPIRLIQLGGASGRIAGPAILDTPYTYEDLEKAGVGVGSGAVLVVDERTSVLDFLRITQRFFSHESCGQCTPCREGNSHMQILLETVARGEHSDTTLDTMDRLCMIMQNASLCGLGETAQNAFVSAREWFPEVFAPARQEEE